MYAEKIQKNVELIKIPVLFCFQSPRQTAQYLYWYHNNQMVNYGSGISVHTEPGIHTHSRLTIPLAGPQHAGKRHSVHVQNN